MIRIPPHFSKYGNFEAERGQAQIRLEKFDAKTVVKSQRTKAPLLVQRALYPEWDRAGMPHVYLMSSAGGILQGDRLEIGIDAGENTTARITTQAATKIYRMEKGFAAQTISIDAHRGSYVEFLPHQLIPFKSSRFFQDVDLNVSSDSTVIYSETVCAGRTASGEKFDFEVCFLRMTARDRKGSVLFSDASNIEPNGRKFELLFGGKTIWSTMYIVTSQDHDVIDLQIERAIRKRSMLAGCSALPRNSGLFVRILDDSIDKVGDLTNEVVEVVRTHTM
jgi:urease accessory protein